MFWGAALLCLSPSFNLPLSEWPRHEQLLPRWKVTHLLPQLSCIDSYTDVVFCFDVLCSMGHRYWLALLASKNGCLPCPCSTTRSLASFITGGWKMVAFSSLEAREGRKVFPLFALTSEYFLCRVARPLIAFPSEHNGMVNKHPLLPPLFMLRLPIRSGRMLV